MLVRLHSKEAVQLAIGFAFGVAFGFLLQKGGATDYNVITGQLLLVDFTIVKIMLSAIVTGMIGIHALSDLGLVRMHLKPGSLGSTAVGGLIFGVGFGILGYCPGTIAGAIGQGSLDALFGGLLGILAGSALFAEIYEMLDRRILRRGFFGEVTIPVLFGVNYWRVVIPLALMIAGLLFALDKFGL